MAATMAPPPPQPANLIAETGSRSKKKKLEVEAFSGNAGENVVSWLETISQAQQRQLVLYGEGWSPQDIYYGMSAHLKGAAATGFRKLNAQTPMEFRNMAYLEMQLRDTYGSRESAWKAPIRLIHRRQQPGEFLRDYANSLTKLGAGHPGLPGEFYIDAFARDMNNRLSARTVTAAKPRTLEQAVGFAIDNCGKYGECAEVNN